MQERGLEPGLLQHTITGLASFTTYAIFVEAYTEGDAGNDSEKSSLVEVKVCR